MKIYFVERNKNKLEKLKLYFKDEINIEYVGSDTIVKLMYEAYKQLKDVTYELNWDMRIK